MSLNRKNPNKINLFKESPPPYLISCLVMNFSLVHYIIDLCCLFMDHDKVIFVLLLKRIASEFINLELILADIVFIHDSLQITR